MAKRKAATIIEAARALSGQCDGAVAKDGVGFNGSDSPFAKSVLEQARLTQKQLDCLHRMLRKYKGQLSGLGFEYDKLVLPKPGPVPGCKQASLPKFEPVPPIPVAPKPETADTNFAPPWRPRLPWTMTPAELVSHFPVGMTPRPQQLEALAQINEAFRSGKRVVALEMPVGCHAVGQGILMYDGSVKPVEQVKLGDQLMGPDSRPRTVLELRQGFGPMNEICPIKGDIWNVNEDHVLTLVRTERFRKPTSGNRRRDYRGGEVIDVTVRDWKGWTNNKKHMYKLFRVAVDFQDNSSVSLPIAPHFLGLLLGDGGFRGGTPTLTKPDPEIYEAAQAYATSTGTLTAKRSPSRLDTIRLSGTKNRPNHLTSELTLLGLWGVTEDKRFIPEAYKRSSRSDRFRVLAGLLDTDGSLGNNVFDFISKSKRLSNDVCFVARSLGFSAYLRSCRKSDQNGTWGDYYRVCISGSVNMIPTTIPRKQGTVRLQKKSVLRTGFTVQPTEAGKFFGFVLDADGRYVLEDFTVTHNSGKSFVCMTVANAIKSLGGNTHFLTAQRVLQKQYERDFPSPAMEVLMGRSNYPCNHPSAETGTDAAHGVCRRRNKGILIDCIDEDSVPESPDDQGPLQRAVALELPASCHRCPYWAQLQKSNDHSITLYNFSSFLFQQRIGRFGKRDLMLIDEAHATEGNLMSFVSLELPEWLLSIIGVELTAEISSKAQFADWLREADVLRKIDNAIKGVEGSSEDTPDDLSQVESDALRELQTKLSTFMAYLDVTEWVLETVQYTNRQKEQARKIQARPLYAKHFAQDLLFSKADRILAMSGTILDVTLWAENLGLDPREVAFVSMPSDFPVENRPIFLSYAGNCSRKTLEETKPRLVRTVQAIMDAHHGQRGLIHTQSHDLAGFLRRTISSSRFLFADEFDGDKEEMLQAHADRPDSVLVSPGMKEGVDLRGELGRFQILLKMPWASLGDKVVKERMERDPQWYAYKCILDVLQSLGRIVRSREDWGFSYLLDSGFESVLARNGHMIPGWVKAAFRRELPKEIRRV